MKLARSRKEDFNFLLTRYAMEREAPGTTGRGSHHMTVKTLDPLRLALPET